VSFSKFFHKLKSHFRTPAPAEFDQRWLSNMLDILPKPFFLLDFEKKRVSFSNAAARKMLGLSAVQQEVSDADRRNFSIYSLDGTALPAENLPSARALRGERLDGEEYLLSSQAGHFHIKVFTEEIPAMHGRPAAALIVFQDITNLKNTEAELRRAQADLREAVETAQVGFWSVDTQTKITSLSSQLLRQFGLGEESADANLGNVILSIHPEDRDRVSKAIDVSIADGVPYLIEYRVVHPDGQVRWIEAKSGPTGDLTADATRFTGTTLDITERVQARQAIEAREREFRLLADAMPQIVWSARPTGELDYFNQRWFDYSGSEYGDNEGHRWTQFVHPEDIPRTVERWQQALQSKSTYETEFRLRAENGQYRWHVARARAIFETGPDGNPILKKWYGTNTDIHDQKTLADKLDEARTAAERANSAKSQFLANMSHEIRTPLGAIMGFSELIKDNAASTAQREEYVAVIERNSAQLLRIIDDILDLTKVEAGMMVIENIEFSLPETLTDFASLMEFKAREKGIQFVLKSETALPSVIHSDPTRLRQILMNVVGNAIKFTDHGKVEMRVSFQNDFLDFEIQDTGRGISPIQAANLFQPFTQADSSTTRKYGGTGLGLALTRSLAEAMHGHFALNQSALGEGSVFSVRIQARAKVGAKLYSGLGPEIAPARPSAKAGQLQGIKILLVEDSPDNQALISIYLSRAGASVDIASDGEQGCAMALGGDYDIVLMDVQMPILDGIGAVKKLRQSGYDKTIVALTAHAMKEERLRCLQAGFSDFLSKPIVREELISKVRAAKDL
jgi:PAS domain S-box-containing protein